MLYGVNFWPDTKTILPDTKTARYQDCFDQIPRLFKKNDTMLSDLILAISGSDFLGDFFKLDLFLSDEESHLK